MTLTSEGMESQIQNQKETLATLENKYKSIKDMEKKLHAKGQDFEDLNRSFLR